MTAEHDKARAILRRVEDDQRSFAGPGESRGAEINPADPVEVWAKRVGRALGYGLLALLALNLATGWFF